MKRPGRIWPQVCSFDNLHLAWRKARRGKARRDDVARSALDLEANLIGLQRQLAGNTR